MTAFARSWVIATLLSAAGCASTPGEKMARDVDVVREERTQDKLVERGLAFARVGDLTRAEQYLAAALDDGADEARVLPALLDVCVAAKRYRVAIDYAAPVLARKPNDAHLRFVVASLRATVGDVERAREDLAKVVDALPSDPTVRFAYAVLLRDRCSDVVRADEQFRAYLRLSPRGEHADEARASLLARGPAATNDDPPNGVSEPDAKALP